MRRRHLRRGLRFGDCDVARTRLAPCHLGSSPDTRRAGKDASLPAARALAIDDKRGICSCSPLCVTASWLTR